MHNNTLNTETKQKQKKTSDLQLETVSNQTNNSEKLPKIRPRLKKYCEFVLQGQTQVEAYKNAGFRVKNDNIASTMVSRLLQDIKVQKYLEMRENELHEELKKKTSITREQIINNYLTIYNNAIKKDSVSFQRLARETSDSLSKCLGLFIDRQEITNIQPQPQLIDLPLTAGNIATIAELFAQLMQASQTKAQPAEIAGSYQVESGEKAAITTNEPENDRIRSDISEDNKQGNNNVLPIDKP